MRRWWCCQFGFPRRLGGVSGDRTIWTVDTGNSHRNSSTWPTIQYIFPSTLIPHRIKPTTRVGRQRSTIKSPICRERHVLEVRTTAGNTSHNLISGTRTFPFFLASRITIASLNAPEKKISDTSVPRTSPRNRIPCISGVHSMYAVGRKVITERIHQYLYPSVNPRPGGNQL